MVTAEERIKILQMLQDGKITPEAAAQLLDAMGEGDTPPEVIASPAEDAQKPLQETARQPRWLHVRVTDTNSGRPRVNVRLPIGLVNLGMKLGSKYAPEIEGIDLAGMLQAAQTGGTGTFVDVVDEEEGEHVEVFLE